MSLESEVSKQLQKYRDDIEFAEAIKSLRVFISNLCNNLTQEGLEKFTSISLRSTADFKDEKALEEYKACSNKIRLANVIKSSFDRAISQAELSKKTLKEHRL